MQSPGKKYYNLKLLETPKILYFHINYCNTQSVQKKEKTNLKSISFHNFTQQYTSDPRNVEFVVSSCCCLVNLTYKASNAAVVDPRWVSFSSILFLHTV